MYHRAVISDAPCLPLSPDAENELDAVGHQLVRGEEERSRNKRKPKHHRCRNQRLTARWPSYLCGFRPDLLDKNKWIGGLGRHLPLLFRALCSGLLAYNQANPPAGHAKLLVWLCRAGAANRRR